MTILDNKCLRLVLLEKLFAPEQTRIRENAT